MDKTEEEFEKTVKEYLKKWFPNATVDIQKIDIDTESDEPDIVCQTCINSIMKRCKHCDSEKRECVLLGIDVDDDFYCKMWAMKWFV
jgi:hypothetical protein